MGHLERERKEYHALFLPPWKRISRRICHSANLTRGVGATIAFIYLLRMRGTPTRASLPPALTVSVFNEAVPYCRRVGCHTKGLPMASQTAAHGKRFAMVVVYRNIGQLKHGGGGGDSLKVITHGLTSTTPTSAKGPAMTPSELVSAATFIIIIPTALIIRLLTLLNLNAVVLHYPSTLLPHKSGPLASLDNNSTLEFDLNDQTSDFLPLWLSRVFQNHNVSQSIPEWKGQNAPVAVSIHFTVNFAQPPVNHSFDQMVTINMTKPRLQNRVPHSVFPSNTTAHLHNKASHPPDLGDHEDRVPRTERPLQFAGDVIDLLTYAVGTILVCFAVRRQAFRLRSPYRSLLHMIRNSRVTVSSRGYNEHARNQKDFQDSHYEDIVLEGKYFNTHLTCFQV